MGSSMPSTKSAPRSSDLPPPPVVAPEVRDLDTVLVRLHAQERGHDSELLHRVYDFSAKMHAEQKRQSGEPYMMHPLAVAWHLADLNFDATCVAVGLLHDVLEDTLTDRPELAERFGEDVAELVDGVTKIGQHQFVSRITPRRRASAS